MDQIQVNTFDKSIEPITSQSQEIESQEIELSDNDVNISSDSGSISSLSDEETHKITSAQKNDRPFKRFKSSKKYENNTLLVELSASKTAEQSSDIIKCTIRPKLQSALALILDTMEAKKGYVHVTKHLNTFLNANQSEIESLKMERLSTCSKPEITGNIYCWKIYSCVWKYSFGQLLM